MVELNKTTKMKKKFSFVSLFIFLRFNMVYFIVIVHYIEKILVVSILKVRLSS
jgi:hypothetical protein